MSRRTRPFLDFKADDGRVVARAPVSEVGGRGNKHFNLRRSDGPRCPTPGCNEAFAPICPDIRCPGSKVPRAMMRLERIDHGTVSSDEAKANVDRIRREAHGETVVERKPEREHRPQRSPATRHAARKPRVKVASEADTQRLQRHFDRRRA